MSHGQESHLKDESQLQDILGQLEALQGQLRQFLPRPSASKESYLIQPDDQDLGALARLELSQRNIRYQLFPEEIFGEAGWNILIDLFVQEKAEKKVSITSACLASRAPETTGLRYVKLLLSLGLVAREDDPNDLRKSYLCLTPDCREKISQFLSNASKLRPANAA